MKRGSFIIGKKFLIDPRIDRLFEFIHAESKETREDVVKYVGVSNLFNEVKGAEFKLGFKDGEFRAFEANAQPEEGWIYLSDPEGNFATDTTIKVPGSPTKKPVAKKISYNELYTKAKEHGFIAKEHKDRKEKTLLKFLSGLSNTKLDTGVSKKDTKKEEKKMVFVIKSDLGWLMDSKGKAPFKMTSEKEEAQQMTDSAAEQMKEILEKEGLEVEIQETELRLGTGDEKKPGPGEVIKTYEVLKEESVKNASGSLEVGSIINESQEFETPFGKMLKDGSIKEVKE